MIIIITLVVITIGAAIAIIRSKRPVREIFAEAKFEIAYNVMGSKALLEDFLMKKKNKTELPLLTGKVAVITGGTRGIGLEIIKMLLQCDLVVIMGCRNVKLGESLLPSFRYEGILTGDLKVFKLDVSSFKSVRAFTDEVTTHYPKIHILINNAGIMYVPYMESVDGYESQLATNYLGHFLLTHGLMKQLKAGGEEGCNARVVNVTSVAHTKGRIDFEDINFKNQQYISFAAYAQTKLAQMLFSNYLDTLMQEQGAHVRFYSVHPGLVNTDLFDDTYVRRFIPWAPILLFKTPEKGAIPVVYAAVSPKLEKRGGVFISNCRERTPSKECTTRELQEKLFDFTKEIFKIEEFGEK